MRSLASIYDTRFYFFCLCLFGLLCLLMKMTGGVAFGLLFLFILVGFSRNKTEMLFYCLILTTLITMTNGFFVTRGLSFSVMNRMVYILIGGVMVLQMVSLRKSNILTPMLSIFYFIVYMAITSWGGWQPIISILKIVLFTITFLAFYSVASATAVRQNVSFLRLRSILLACASIEILGSTCLIPFPRIGVMDGMEFFLKNGYVPEGSLFMGMTLQSQALGPIVAVLSSILLADMLFTLGRWHWLYLLMLGCSAVLIYKTGSRTAMGTWLFGLAFVGFIFMCAKRVNRRWKSNALGVLTGLGLSAGVVLLAMPQSRAKALSFMYKTHGAEVAEENRGFDKLISSRQGLMDHAIANFQGSPLIGNGFQVSEKMQTYQIVSYKQLLSAPVEKGVWVTAVLEEGGIFGFLIFLAYVVYVGFSLFKSQAFVGLSAFVVTLVANLGEFTFFSVSGMGGVFWAFIFIALVIDIQRNKVAKKVVYERVIWTNFQR